jgi:hypothetical protein
LNGGKKIQLSVAVPEAWVLTIKVKSLLATTGNLILSQILEGDSVSTNTSTTENAQ